MLRKSYYLTLGIPLNESAGGIRQAFHEIVRRYHPDRVGFERLRFFQEIVEAYRVLSDPERRRDYDRGLFQADVTTPAPLLVESSRGDLPLSHVDLTETDDQGCALRGGAGTSERESYRRPKSDRKSIAKPSNATVLLSPDEAVQGGIIFLAVPSCSPCDRCGGAGRDGLFPCAQCDGEGLIEEAETVRVHVSAYGRETVPSMKVPLRGLGVHNFYLRLHIRVGSAMRLALGRVNPGPRGSID